jgi:hypothetical protein
MNTKSAILEALKMVREVFPLPTDKDPSFRGNHRFFLAEGDKLGLLVWRWDEHTQIVTGHEIFFEDEDELNAQLLS